MPSQNPAPASPDHALSESEWVSIRQLTVEYHQLNKQLKDLDQNVDFNVHITNLIRLVVYGAGPLSLRSSKTRSMKYIGDIDRRVPKVKGLHMLIAGYIAGVHPHLSKKAHEEEVSKMLLGMRVRKPSLIDEEVAKDMSLEIEGDFIPVSVLLGIVSNIIKRNVADTDRPSKLTSELKEHILFGRRIKAGDGLRDLRVHVDYLGDVFGHFVEYALASKTSNERLDAIEEMTRGIFLPRVFNEASVLLD